jgi:hypothetical protein
LWKKDKKSKLLSILNFGKSDRMIFEDQHQPL